MQGKLDIGQVIGRVFNLYGSRWGSLLGLGLVFFAATFVLWLAFIFIFMLLLFGGGTPESVLLMVLVFVVAILLGWATYHGSVIRIAQNAHQGRNERLGESISAAFSRAGALVLAEILVGLCLFGPPLLMVALIGPNPGAALGLLLFLFPGLYFGARFAVTIPTVVVERKGAMASMERSWKLTASNALRVFAVMLIFAVVAIVATRVLQIVLGGSNGGQLLYSLFNMLLIWPLMALLTAVIYFDLRGPEPAPTVPTFGLPPVGAPAAIPAAGTAFQTTSDLPPGVGDVTWDTSSSKPPPPPGS